MPYSDKKSGKEKYAWVLDYLPYGDPDDPRPAYQKKPSIQGIGETYFVLMELVPKEGMAPLIGDQVHIGNDGRDVIDHVKRRLEYADLTHGAKSELAYVLESIVMNNESRFVKFINESYPISTRQHMLELLPGIGKKLMWAILDERKRGDFTSFEDLTTRVKGLHKPETIFAHQIENELTSDVRYRLFTTKPPESRPSEHSRKRGRR
ncbi:MAG: DUF655 domain-containing protein [Euryarchaeota archaeon]|nr:MAG: hypothetical protein C5S47_02185 [ANME-2 cluster archaeon]MEA1865051.1 DUF655 domain-containing protein [Euryarchaeota archaeon]